MEVAQDLIRVADVFSEETEERLVGPALLVELYRWDLEALLIDLPRAERILRAADIGHMADRAHEPHRLAVPEDGRDDGDVEELREPRIVGDQHVAGLERMGRIPGQQRLHGPR